MVRRRRRSIAVEIAGQARRERIGVQKRLQLAKLRRLVGERKVFGGRLEEEVERIVDGHFGHQVDLDPELVDLLGEREPRDVVALRILLPVQKVTGRRDALRIGQNRRAAVRRRTQANELRRQFDGPVVPVLRHVAKRDVDAQGVSHLYYFRDTDLPLRPGGRRPGSLRTTELNVFADEPHATSRGRSPKRRPSARRGSAQRLRATGRETPSSVTVRKFRKRAAEPRSN